MLCYARTLESPVIADVMATSEPLDDSVPHVAILGSCR
jgi:hypothetical protein